MYNPPPPNPPGAPYPQQPPPAHNMAKGTFDLGDGHQLQLKVDGKTPENYLKDKASGMIFGWILGAVILGLVVVTVVGVGIYVYVVAKDTSSPVAAAKAAEAAKWDGKSTFECGGNDVVTIKGVTANVSGTAIRAAGSCQLTLVGVSITAPTGIEAGGNAKVTVSGGSVKSSGQAIVASANAKVDVAGAAISGKVQKSGAAKVTGTP